jgi:hypothetical protein
MGLEMAQKSPKLLGDFRCRRSHDRLELGGGLGGCELDAQRVDLPMQSLDIGNFLPDPLDYWICHDSRFLTARQPRCPSSDYRLLRERPQGRSR